MQPLQTTEGIVLAGSIDDLKDLIVEKCGYEIWEFIKYEDVSLINDLKSQVEDLESDCEEYEKEKEEYIDTIDDLESNIKELEKELEQLKHDPIIIPIESLKKSVDLDDLDDEECIPF